MPMSKKLKRTIKTGTQYRMAQITRSDVNEESRTISLSFSSEAPVERYWGIEILDHNANSVRLNRLNAGGPVLVDHYGDQVGVVENASIGSDRKGHADVRFGKGARSDEIFQDVIDGIRQNVSVGYRINRMVLEKEEDGVSTYRVTDWEPLEISIVSVPADVSVGVGRSHDDAGQYETEIIIPKQEDRIMNKCEKCGTDMVNGVCPACEANRSAAGSSIDVASVREDANRIERGRVAEIDAIGEQFGLDAALVRKHIQSGTSVNDFRKVVLDEIRTKAVPVSMPNLSDKEQRQYSVVRALRAAAGLCRRDDAGYEFEISAAIGRALGKGTDGIYVPTGLNVFPELGRAGLDTVTVSPTNAGGYTVQTSVMPLIEMLRNKLLLKQMGARVLSLRNPVAFPRQSGAATLYWTAENPGSDTTDSTAAFEQLLLTPKTGIANTAYSKQLLMESSMDVENFVRDDLVSINAVGLDGAGINGAGTAEPVGILATSGIGAIVGGTDGATPTWAHIVGLETEVAIDNADFGSLGYLSNAKVRGLLKQTLKTSGVSGYIWENGQGGFGEMNGYRAGATNQVPSNLTKNSSVGICSAIIFGNWAELIIAEFGVVELIVDPYSKKKQAMIEVTSTMLCDIGLRHPASFAAMKDALTA